MNMFYILINARPKPGTSEASKTAGAFVNCWVLKATENEAKDRVSFMLENDGWIINEIQEIKKVDKEYYSSDSEGLAYFEQALTDGEVLIINTWPLEIQ